MARAARLVGLSLAARLGTAAVTSGSVAVPADGAAFLAKFCFGYDQDQIAGFFNVTVRLPASSSADAVDDGQVALALFDDQAESYPPEESAKWAGVPCDDKLRHAKWTRRIPLEATAEAGFSVEIPMREKIRPRWWFVAVADCSGSGVALDYSVHTLNPLLGWQQELSFDRRGLPLLCAGLLLALGALLAAQLRANSTGEPAGSRASHPVVKILTAAIGSAVCGALLLTLHYFRLARDGSGFVALYLGAKLLQAISKFLIMSILMLVSKGKCVSRPLERADISRALGALGPFALLCFTLEIWGEWGESQKYTADFVYASRSGAALVAVDLLLLAAYLANLRASLAAEADPVRRVFYRLWGAVYAAWFLALPGTVLLSRALAPWVRFGTVFVVASAAHVATLAALVVGLWPSRKSYFQLEELELEAVYESEWSTSAPWLPLAG